MKHFPQRNFSVANRNRGTWATVKYSRHSCSRETISYLMSRDGKKSFNLQPSFITHPRLFSLPLCKTKVAATRAVRNFSSLSLSPSLSLSLSLSCFQDFAEISSLLSQKLPWNNPLLFSLYAFPSFFFFFFQGLRTQKICCVKHLLRSDCIHKRRLKVCMVKPITSFPFQSWFSCLEKNAYWWAKVFIIAIDDDS